MIFASFSSVPPKTEAIKWHSWDEAIELNKPAKKKIFIDVYTEWCGFCKRMDRSTFQNPEVIKYINEHFIAVKFDAEQKENITYKNHMMKYVSLGKRGYHELAYSLLDGKMSYPAFVYLAEDERRISISPGYKDAKMIMKELTYIAGDHYKTTSFVEFSKNHKSE